MALVDTDLFLVQDAITKSNYKLKFDSLIGNIEASIDLDSVYVRNDGDNVTGDLTLGPVGDTKITLDATNGNIDIAAKITAQAGNFVRVEGVAGLELYGDSSSPRAICLASSGDTTIEENLVVEKDGEFKNNIEITNNVTLGGKLTASSAQITTKIDGSSGINIYSSPSVQVGIEIDAVGDVNVGNKLTVVGDTTLSSQLNVTGNAYFSNVEGDKFTGAFSGDGSELINLPTPPGLWQIADNNLSPRNAGSSIIDVIDITISGELKADLIDGGEYV